MKISYNRLKSFIEFDQTPEEIAKILTDTGLEVDSIEKYESIKGGLEGLVIGEVITKIQHPNADKLSITTVNLGTEQNYQIVCGAPNVQAGQKVVVATIGAKLYDNDKEFEIKKSKIRGEESFGMICAEDEIGLGTSHDGIMVLPEDVKPGTSAKEYFGIETDYTIEIGLTPNRADAASHLGVARDLSAYFKHNGISKEVKIPSIENFSIDNKNLEISVDIENLQACKRYSGLTISGVQIQESPSWLKMRLKALGLSSINNVVDVTNIILHELGQPLHAFDADMIKGNKVIVKTLSENTPFVTLDGVERKLSGEDLMICNKEEGMCIAGVFGGLHSGVSNSTTKIFLESAYFNPVSVRKTSKKHALQTDSSFRFERGTDPNITVYALICAASLIKELAGGEISSDIVDVYPEPVSDFRVEVEYKHVKRLLGLEIPKQTIKNILLSLEIKIVQETDEKLILDVPPYRVDVTREADVIEEILRIYGYNNIPVNEHVNSTLSYAAKPDENKLRNRVSDYLSSVGFSEAMANSLTKETYYDAEGDYKKENSVKIMNPLSSDLGVLRQTLLFGALESVLLNNNHKNSDIAIYEFGNVYKFKEGSSTNTLERYDENQRLALTISGNKTKANWNSKEEKFDFFYLKTKVDNLLVNLNIATDKIKVKDTESDTFSYGLTYMINNSAVVNFGKVSKKYISKFDIDKEVFFADFDWKTILKVRKDAQQFVPFNKFPTVKRDLALLIDKQVNFGKIKEIAFKTEKKLLKEVSIFDIFESDKLGENKKSYAVSFYLQDEEKTLTDNQIDKIMNKFIGNFKHELGAELR